ncbi:Imm32 family immunity protein [Wukongibacter sp. M2B1]|uniref:Imm32 family immunity protein n=1 Tax=Wukongibacter sp. M2B1 TaxID=3088895 RepID=UPI003D7B7252
MININNDEFDEFDRNADNVGIVHVLDENDEVMSNAKVQLYLNRNSLLGLGTELIRLAYNYVEGKHYHIEPADKETLCQRLGIFLTPDSNELIICCSDQDTIDEYLE